MSYTPTNWQTGDIVSSEKLNKLENRKSEFKVFELSKDNVLAQTSMGCLQSLLTTYFTNPGTNTRMAKYLLTIGTDITENEFEQLKAAAQYVKQHGIGYFYLLNGLYPILSCYYDEEYNEWRLTYTILAFEAIANYYFNITFKISASGEEGEEVFEIIIIATPLTDYSEDNNEENNSGGGSGAFD